MDLAAFQQCNGIRFSVRDFLYQIGGDHVMVQHGCGTACTVQFEAHTCQLICNLNDFLLVAVADRNQHAAFLLQVIACGDQTLEQCVLQIGGNTQTLTSRLHFRSEHGVYVL